MAKLKIPELKEKLRSFGKGSKNELVARLASHHATHVKSIPAPGSVSSCSPNSSATFQCPICEGDVHDNTQESIYCSGHCKTWVHRGCGGLSPSAFTSAKSFGTFHCPSCRLNYQSDVVSSLESRLDSLSEDLSWKVAT